jgi:hypothetical protein
MQIRSSHADTKGRMILLGFMYGPKALISSGLYGTAEAMPYVQRVFR